MGAADARIAEGSVWSLMPNRNTFLSFTDSIQGRAEGCSAATCIPTMPTASAGEA